MAKHRRDDADMRLAIQQYEQLVTVLYRHRPGEQSGLCLVCGIGWPCTEVLLPLERGHTSGDLSGDSSSSPMRSGER
jgi:hypothetical protein